MVRYRQEAGERGYTFRLTGINTQSLLTNGLSPNGTISDQISIGSESHSVLDSSVVLKERIDSLFRERAFNGQNGIKISQLGAETVKADEPTMEHLKMHFQKVLAEHRGTPISTVGSKNKSSTYIQAHDQFIKKENKKIESGVSDKTPEVASESSQRSFSAAAIRSQSFNEARNAVQAQIEKMFQDAAKVCTVRDQEDGTTTSNATKAVIAVRSSPPPSSSLPSLPPGLHNKQSMPLPPIPTAPNINILPPADHPRAQTHHISTAEADGSDRMSSTTNNKYKVDYLGSLALQGRATSLESLQLPLKELYCRYRHALANKLNIYRGTMDISAAGLRIQYYSDWRTVIPVEIVNPFPTIAVWAAVKFVYRIEPNSSASVAAEENMGKKFAFLPLICDPENQEKHNLFHCLGPNDADLTIPVTHPPMFTCVMRKTGAPKTLECHAFVCDNPEDAIVIAANLYQALLRNMKTTEKSCNGTNALNSKKCSNTVLNSVADSIQRSVGPEPIYSPDTSVSNWSDSSTTSCSGFAPVRPPRRKKRIASADPSGLATGLEKRKSIRRSNSKARVAQGKPNLRRSMRSSSQRSQRVKRSVSDRQLGNMLVQTHVSDGDILTKVAIPRSKSFMTVPQNYSLGELFDELKKQEGVQSVDDVLKVIVNKDRMSFNDLQPAYKELLMKLALTLSKDEMFQRSKNIMRNQTAKSNKNTRNTISSAKFRDSDAEHSSSSRISSVLRATKKSLSKWSVRSGSGYSVNSKESNTIKSLGLPKTTQKFDQSLALSSATKCVTSKTPLNTRSASNGAKVISNQSNDQAGQGHGKVGTKETSKATDLKDYISCSECAYDSETCSQKCYCSVNDIRKRKTTNPAMDTDTDDCSDGEKCYCSLSRVKTGPNDNTPIYRINLDSDSDASHASHASSNTSSQNSLSSLEQAKKLYNKPSKNRHNYARKSGSLTSWTALSGAESPLTAWRKNTASIAQQNHIALAETTRFNQANAGSLRQKSLSSYLSDTSLDSDIVAMTEPAKKSSSIMGTVTPGSGKNSFAKNPELLRQKSRSSYLSSETELESLTTSCNSFVRAPIVKHNQASGYRKASPSGSVGYQSYDSTGSSNGKSARHFFSISSESLSTPSCRRNSNSSSDRSQNGNRSNKKVLMVSAVDPKGKVVYRGTSSAGLAQHRSPATGPSEGVLSVKKTAEIAAMFSNLKLNQTTDIIIDNSATEDTESDISTDDAYSSMRFRGNSNQNGFSNGLEDSLGYLP